MHNCLCYSKIIEMRVREIVKSLQVSHDIYALVKAYNSVSVFRYSSSYKDIIQLSELMSQIYTYTMCKYNSMIKMLITPARI